MTRRVVTGAELAGAALPAVGMSIIASGAIGVSSPWLTMTIALVVAMTAVLTSFKRQWSGSP